jgi:putative acetyltransferase
VVIRPAASGDHAAIGRLNDAAFGGTEEGLIVERLRADGEITAELVTADGGEIVGHILFSRLPIETGRRIVDAVALAPMCVRPDRQRTGVGSALVRAGLEACREQAVEAVVVVGWPEYYPRFGFTAEAAQTLSAPFSGPAFMVLELRPGALSDGGVVRYPAAFGL